MIHAMNSQAMVDIIDRKMLGENNNNSTHFSISKICLMKTLISLSQIPKGERGSSSGNETIEDKDIQ
jgi:hypothetical protein